MTPLARWVPWLNVVTAVVVVTLLGLVVIGGSRARDAREAEEATRDARIEKLILQTKALAADTSSVSRQVADLLVLVSANSAAAKDIGTANQAILSRVEALSIQLRNEAEQTRIAQETILRELLQGQRDLQLAALEAVQKAQEAAPSQPPLIDPTLLDSLIDALRPGKGRK